jgi:hypothetical protein
VNLGKVLGEESYPVLDIFFVPFLFLIICDHEHLKRKILDDAFSFSQDCFCNGIGEFFLCAGYMST